MKKQLQAIAVMLTISTAVHAQLPVGTSPQNKKAVLEEFTGIHCGYCPDGHKIGTQIYNADPNNVILINIHSGSFANAAVGEPDFKTPEGTAIDGMSGMLITGYPAGAMNRLVLASPQTAGGMATGRGAWTANAATVKAQSADCNVALQGTLDVQTRVLTVDVEVYYTANSAAATNSLHVFLLEDRIPGPQSNYGNPLYNLANYNADGTYNHNHLLRKALTPTFGMTIPNTTATTLFSTQLTYTIPASYGAVGKTTIPMLGNMEIVAFVTETDRKITNADDGPITMVNFANTVDVASTDLVTEAAVCAGNITPTMKFMNNGSTAVTSAVFSYAINGGAPVNYNWSGTAVNPMTKSTTFTLGTVSFIPQASNTIVVNVVSVNGGADGNAANNIASKTIANNTLIANSLNMQMDFTQDRYGSECQWTLYNEATNAVISTDGPWADLAANGTLLHTKTFTVAQGTCHKLVVTDAYGDGINAGYGVGGYVLRAGGSPLITSNGQYAKGETKLYKTYTVNINPVSVAEISEGVSQVMVYPNPGKGNTTISLNLQQNDQLSVTVYNQLGQVVFETPAKEYAAGSNSVEFDSSNWSAGLYNIVVKGSQMSETKKLTVTK